MNLSEDQILTLAPDESSKKSGKDLAQPSKWGIKGQNDQALWGECQGSGSKPYQTAVDLINIAFKCSCPSRKFPCKHGLALALLFVRKPETFTSPIPPGWVMEWISKRDSKEEKKAETKEAVVDEAAQAKLRQNREQKVQDGIGELHLWIKDIIRNGLIHVPEKGHQFWEGMARRMIDAQAPGLASLVKKLGQVNVYQEGWQTEFLDRLLTLYLLVCGYSSKTVSSPGLQEEIRSLIGFSQNGDDLKEQKGIVDTWMVLGKETLQEDQLTVERNWLQGTRTGQSALVLRFLVRGQGGSGPVLTPGMCIRAELVFYPSAVPLRALVKWQEETDPAFPENRAAHWEDVAQRQAFICAQTPFDSLRPFVVEGLLPVRYQDRWWLQDRKKNIMPLKQEFAGIWKLLALSGGEDLPMAVLGQEDRFEPLGVWHEGRYKFF